MKIRIYPATIEPDLEQDGRVADILIDDTPIGGWLEGAGAVLVELIGFELINQQARVEHGSGTRRDAPSGACYAIVDMEPEG